MRLIYFSITVAIVLISFFLSCKRNPTIEDIKPKIVESVSKYVKTMAGEHFTIDSIWIISIDTLTDKSIANQTAVSLQSKFNTLNADGSYLNTKYELSVKKAALNKSLFGRDDLLTTMAIEDADKAKKEVQSNIVEMKMIAHKMDSIVSLIGSGFYDSTSFRGYLPKAYISLVNKASGVVSGDSIYIMIDDKFHIIESKK